MRSLLFKLHFTAPLHIGSSENARSQEGSSMTFCADTLFSALCCTAAGGADQTDAERLCNAVREGRLWLSDSFPFCGERLYLPKPFIRRVATEAQAVSERKAAKKLRYIPIDQLREYLDYLAGKGSFSPAAVHQSFGIAVQSTRAAVFENEDTVPYSVGSFSFAEGCGLYVIVRCEDKLVPLLEMLMQQLGIGGIGGKISSGYGSFVAETLPFDGNAGGQLGLLYSMLTAEEADYFITLSASLPQEEELAGVVGDAEIAYSLIRRAGFVQSFAYGGEPLKKKTQHFFCAGSAFRRRYAGALYDVAPRDEQWTRPHPVLRYGKAMMMGVKL
ncbi:MAG: type III-A CRISPR-associated RAMP protein Csm4 [Ruminococcaceae bacterium]|nr:type III-A CRISPR-associated RAMP protein Csm4 [Oscillospiraceae bacterium]